MKKEFLNIFTRGYWWPNSCISGLKLITLYGFNWCELFFSKMVKYDDPLDLKWYKWVIFYWLGDTVKFIMIILKFGIDLILSYFWCQFSTDFRIWPTKLKFRTCSLIRTHTYCAETPNIKKNVTNFFRLCDFSLCFLPFRYITLLEFS